VHVLSDGVTCYNPEHHALALQRIQAAGGVVTSWESAVYELMGKAEGPTFKAALPHLRERD